MTQEDLTVRELVDKLSVVRVRYEMPDTSAFVRYLPRFDDSQPEELTVHSTSPETSSGQTEKTSRTGFFSLAELVNELKYAYVLVHLFPSTSNLNYFLSGFDTSLAQLEFIGGNYDFNRLWITSGLNNLNMPMAIFLGQRNAVNGQPSVTLVDHRQYPEGQVVYRAVRGAGEHVGEEFFVDH